MKNKSDDCQFDRFTVSKFTVCFLRKLFGCYHNMILFLTYQDWTDHDTIHQSWSCATSLWNNTAV